MGIHKRLQKLLSSTIALPTILLPCLPLHAQQAGFTTQVESPAPLESSDERLNVRYDTYILGPGDRLRIELLDIPELSGNFTIGPDGTLYLPRLRAVKVEGLTIEELRLFLTSNSSLTFDSQRFTSHQSTIDLFELLFGGEVARPGYYTISGVELIRDSKFVDQQKRFDLNNSGALRARPSAVNSLDRSAASISRSAPTLF